MSDGADTDDSIEDNRTPRWTRHEKIREKRDKAEQARTPSQSKAPKPKGKKARSSSEDEAS
eukprot:CAMPEP_0118834940 /NCGR_PEP_ID=MMETSP1162-20130426/52061_1 /TAXON_ID=33656 /ORGANISM="Phaeocystis Sp, Strain CCMP2710" /LENGTH=60 /DNA_ID=CAMNT_0006766681 /DNA_START=3 /DNA_END=181 /DNA_ORIENTATION=-